MSYFFFISTQYKEQMVYFAVFPVSLNELNPNFPQISWISERFIPLWKSLMSPSLFININAHLPSTGAKAPTAPLFEIFLTIASISLPPCVVGQIYAFFPEKLKLKIADVPPLVISKESKIVLPSSPKSMTSSVAKSLSGFVASGLPPQRYKTKRHFNSKITFDVFVTSSQFFCFSNDAIRS